MLLVATLYCLCPNYLISTEALIFALTSLIFLLQDQIKLHGEVFFPNLHFEKMEVDFGCILNDTEVTRYVNITNNSPLEVNYRWSFVLDDEPVAIFRKSVQVPKMSVDLESRDLESKQTEDKRKEIYDEREDPALVEADTVEELDVAIEAGSPRSATQSPQDERMMVCLVLFEIYHLVFNQSYSSETTLCSISSKLQAHACTAAHRL